MLILVATAFWMQVRSESGLNMLYVRESAYSGYYQSNSLWGVALICGDMIQDVLKLDGINGYGGGDRMCVDDDLSSIKASSDEIRDDYQGISSSDFLSQSSPDRSYGYAKCGTNEVN